jgi:hypothetical protein
MTLSDRASRTVKEPIVDAAYVTVRLTNPALPDRVYEAIFRIDLNSPNSMAPASELEGIGITPVTEAHQLGYGRSEAPIFGLARIELLGDVTYCRVLFGPDGIEPTLGFTALESVGISVDPIDGTLRRRSAISLK